MLKGKQHTKKIVIFRCYDEQVKDFLYPVFSFKCWRHKFTAFLFEWKKFKK